MVWMDVFFQENQIVLVGFSIATRILIGVVLGILGLLFWRSGVFIWLGRSSSFEFPVQPLGLKARLNFA